MKHQFLTNLVDVWNRRIRPVSIVFENGRIVSISDASQDEVSGFTLPGFVDAHVHIESSLLTPQGFEYLAAPHGTVATVSDPHEIANVLGLEGVYYMLEQAAKCRMKIHFGAPSCVPATNLETAGARLGVAEVRELLEDPRIRYLAEVMNFPGVIGKDAALLEMIAIAQRLGKRVDGHAPGVRGEQARLYIAAGIETDHECFTADEARDKLYAGMKYVIIREGSAARNFDALVELFHEFPDRIMFGTDDAHPDFLQQTHIIGQVRRALAHGVDLYDVLRAASVNPVEHYGLEVGLLRVGDPADFVVVHDLESLRVSQVFIDGECVASNGRPCFQFEAPSVINKFQRGPIAASDIHVEREGDQLRVIDIIPGQLVTGEAIVPVTKRVRAVVSDAENDILKIVVVNRYDPSAPVAVAFVRGFGFHSGAVASSVAHDSHNVIAVGVTDADIVDAVNMVIANEGGLAYANGQYRDILPLPIAGLMSPEHPDQVAEAYSRLDRYVKDEMQSPLPAPLMTASFLALIVIPQLKLSDFGLHRDFQRVSCFVA